MFLSMFHEWDPLPPCKNNVELDVDLPEKFLPV